MYLAALTCLSNEALSILNVLNPYQVPFCAERSELPCFARKSLFWMPGFLELLQVTRITRVPESARPLETIFCRFGIVACA